MYGYDNSVPWQLNFVLQSVCGRAGNHNVNFNEVFFDLKCAKRLAKKRKNKTRFPPRFFLATIQTRSEIAI